jgi:sensor histidine kinase YesM
MTRHPVLQNRHGIHLYLFIWGLIMVLHVALNVYNEKMEFSIAAMDTILSDALFAGMALGLWYPIRYLNLEMKHITTFLLQHIGMALSFLFVWVNILACTLEILTEDTAYRFLLQQSLPWRVMMGLLFYGLVVLGYYLHIYYSSFKQKQLVEAELTSLVKQTELNLLKSQLNPHFIFNSLNSISSLTMSDPACAQEMVVKLSSYIRYALTQKGNDLVLFSEELENAKLYLDIEKVRFGEKLQLQDSYTDQCLGAKVPNMLLQPLLENAIKHGVYESLTPVHIHLEIGLTDEVLTIKIKNNYDPENRIKGNGIGLKNCKERLILLYGEKGTFKISDTHHVFQVEMTVPQHSPAS